METTATDGGVWSETSVQAIIWDLYDSTNSGEGSDTLNLGFSTLYSSLKNRQKTTTALTTIISFINGLKAENPTMSGTIDNIVNMNGIGQITSDFDVADIAVGVTEPTCRTSIYTNLTLGAAPLTSQALSTNPAGSGSTGTNKFCATKYYRLTGAGTSKTITMTPSGGCDADIYLFLNGTRVASAFNGLAGAAENITFTLANATTYVLEVRLYTNTTSCTFSVGTN